MKTLLIKVNANDKSQTICSHYEVVGYKGKKFLIYVEGSNGNPIGFNYKCCLKVMNEKGSWDNVVDNERIGISHFLDGLYYGNSADMKKAMMEENVNEFKDYIKAIY